MCYEGLGLGKRKLRDRDLLSISVVLLTMLGGYSPLNAFSFDLRHVIPSSPVSLVFFSSVAFRGEEE